MSILLRHAAASTTAPPVNYIEDVFSTYLYTGNSSTQTITNGIDLSTKGGLVWIKNRANTGGTWTASHNLYDTVRGMTFTDAQRLLTDTTDAQVSQSNYIRADTTGFSFGTTATGAMVNASSNTYASWTFRKQPKFFDVVTYTGTGANRTIAHNLGSAPGCMIVKCTSHGVTWNVYHRSLTSAAYQLELNTSAEFSDPTIWNSTAPTSTEFSVGTNLGINGSGRTYVAYLFAHDAGGFGLTGTDNVISCGSYTGNGTSTGPVITLGYEPQWVMVKRSAGGTSNWSIFDSLRQFVVTPNYSNRLYANLSDAEAVANVGFQPLATGFQPIDSDSGINASGSTYIYIAIRRGPMKVPTLGTTVYNSVLQSAANTPPRTITGAGFAPDLMIQGKRQYANGTDFSDRLRGPDKFLSSFGTAAEATDVGTIALTMDGIYYSDTGTLNNNGAAVDWFFRRAPSFFDEVCYTGTGANTTQSHNLGAVPELIIVKSRSAATEAEVYVAPLGNDSALNLFGAVGAAFLTGGIAWNYTTPTASVFSLGTWNKVNGSGVTFVAYLFATCPGVSKVGTYTGNGTTQTIACGFAAGARFILIKRTDSTGGWFVWDTSRGIVAGNDPYLLLNSTAAEVTTNDSIDPDASGFIVNQIAATDINVTSASYIFLAIA